MVPFGGGAAGALLEAAGEGERLASSRASTSTSSSSVRTSSGAVADQERVAGFAPKLTIDTSPLVQVDCSIR
jgi:hypothetical protein